MENALVLEFDENWRSGSVQNCGCCGQPSERTWCMVTRDRQPYAVFFVSCYDHGKGDHESWIDVVFGTWGEGTAYTDHVTFDCRFGPVAGSSLPATTAVNAASVAPDNALFGEKLSRDDALRHARLAEFWETVGFITESDPLVHRHHYGHAPDPSVPGKA